MKLKNLKLVLLVSAGSLVISFGYALARHILAERECFGRALEYVFNSFFAFNSAILIAASFLSREIRQKKFFGLFGLCCGVLHAVVSMRLFDLIPLAVVFLKTRTIVFNFELAILCGLFALCIFLILAFTHNKMLAYAGLILLLSHVSIMGYESWFRFSEWPGHLPPITALAFAMMAFILVRGFFYSGRIKKIEAQ